MKKGLILAGRIPKEKKNKDAVRKVREFLLKTGFSDCWNLPYQESELIRTKGGKPYLPGRSDVFFNFSDGREYAAAAFSGQEIGFDLESSRKISEHLLKRLPEDERELIAEGEDEKERQMRFLSLWTMKESRVKQTGEGLSRAAFLHSFAEEYRKALESRESFAIMTESGTISASCGRAFSMEQDGGFCYIQYRTGSMVMTACTRTRQDFDVVFYQDLR